MISAFRKAARWLRGRWDAVERARALGVRIGRDCRVYDCDFGAAPELVAIGDHVTLPNGVQFITHEGGAEIFREEFPDLAVYAPIRIGNNVFIGAQTILLPGAAIGDDCVIGAGSVVAGSIPPGSVAAGFPAKVIQPLAEYRAKILKNAVHIRRLSPREKRRQLCEKFGLA